MKHRKQNLNQDTDSNENIPLDTYGYSKNNRVLIFSNNQEVNLDDYLLKASVLYYGLCTEEISSLAYEHGLST